MPDPLSPPNHEIWIGCPACGHPINDHVYGTCAAFAAGHDSKLCLCRWSPNDIAVSEAS